MPVNSKAQFKLVQMLRSKNPNKKSEWYWDKKWTDVDYKDLPDKKESISHYRFKHFFEEVPVEVLGASTDGNFYIKINGHMYAYEPRGIDINKLVKSFTGLYKHSKGKALNWLKKNAVLVKGSKTVYQEVTISSNIGDTPETPIKKNQVPVGSKLRKRRRNQSCVKVVQPQGT